MSTRCKRHLEAASSNSNAKRLKVAKPKEAATAKEPSIVAATRRDLLRFLGVPAAEPVWTVRLSSQRGRQARPKTGAAKEGEGRLSIRKSKSSRAQSLVVSAPTRPPPRRRSKRTRATTSSTLPVIGQPEGKAVDTRSWSDASALAASPSREASPGGLQDETENASENAAENAAENASENAPENAPVNALENAPENASGRGIPTSLQSTTAKPDHGERRRESDPRQTESVELFRSKPNLIQRTSSVMLGHDPFSALSPCRNSGRCSSLPPVSRSRNQHGVMRSHYSSDVLLYNVRAARRLRSKKDYFSGFENCLHARRVNRTTRAKVMEYILETGKNISHPISPFSIHMAIGLFDRYMSHLSSQNSSSTKDEAAKNMEVVSATCLLLSSKVEDAWSLCLGDVCQTFEDGSIHRQAEVLHWERTITRDFEFEVNCPTVLDFLYWMFESVTSKQPDLRDSAFDDAALWNAAAERAEEAVTTHRLLGISSHVLAAAALIAAIMDTPLGKEQWDKLPSLMKPICQLLDKDDHQQLEVSFRILSELRDEQRRMKKRQGAIEEESSVLVSHSSHVPSCEDVRSIQERLAQRTALESEPFLDHHNRPSTPKSVMAEEEMQFYMKLEEAMQRAGGTRTISTKACSATISSERSCEPSESERGKKQQPK